jgi:uncharacterized membrane protein
MNKLFTPIRLLLLVVLAVVTVIGFVVVPPGTVLPVHWNIAGEADGFLPREFALLMPAAILAAVWIVMILVMRFRPEAERNAGAYVTQVVLTAITGLFVTIAVATVALGAGATVNMVQIIALAVSVLLVVLGNAMPKSQPNGVAGIRIPTTLADPANWQATHRLAGWLTMGGGLILFVAALLMPVNQIVWWLVACVLIPLLIGGIYSVMLARRPR